jgi:hypothetical protein
MSDAPVKPGDVLAGKSRVERVLGVTPFVAPTMVAVMTKVTMDPPVPLEQYRPELPRGLVMAIAQWCSS